MTSSHPNPDAPETGPGLEPAIAATADQPAGQVLAALREAGAKVAVVMDTNGRPHRVVPDRTFAKAPIDRPAASCKPAWPAAVFHEPTNPAERQRNTELWLSGGYERPPFGSRTVVMRGTKVIGLIPVPSLLGRPGPATRVLERALTLTASLILRARNR